MRDHPDARCRAGAGTYYCACVICTKWRIIHPETPIELSVSLFDSLAEFICLFVAKDQSRLVIESFGVKTIVFSQTNSSVGVMKKKKKKKKKMEKIEVRPISVYNCSGVF